ncbi:MAG: hypothetical protein ACE5I3_07295 [Phycisphaerae bacterium]
MLLRIPDRDAFLAATLTLLRERDFPPEQVDRTEGLVVTRPSTGQQWFEFWRRDSLGGYQLFESSIHTVRRIVTVRLAPADAPSPDGNFRVSVRVDKERYSAPERQVTTASGALAIYSERLPTTEGLLASKVHGEHWVPLGRDLPLELYLLDKIAGVLPGVMPVTEGEKPAPAEPEGTPDTS